MRHSLFLVLLLALISLFNHAVAYDPSLNWKTLTSPNFYIHYDERHQALAEKTGKLAESIHQTLSSQLDWTPAQRTHLVLTDHTDLANGYASPIPFNRSVLFIHPPAAGRLDFDSWLESLIVHEYTHVLHLDKATRIPKGMRNVVGRFPMLFPNSFQPAWLIEGYATYMETGIEQSVGRGQSTLFKVMMREELRQGFKSIAEVNMASASWPFNARYLYGYFFYEFLQETYGEKAIDNYIENYSDNWFPYLLNSNANSVFGKDLNQLWNDYEQYLRLKLLDDEVNEPMSSSIKLITNSGFNKYDIEQDTEGNLYVTQNDGVHQAALIKISPQGEQERLLDINQLATIDLMPNGNLLISQPEICDEFYTYYEVYLYETSSKQLRQLTHCSRYIEALWDDNKQSIIALKADGGRFQLDRVSISGQLIETLWQGDDKTVVSQIDLAPHGQSLVASIQRKGNSRANIEEFQFSEHRWQKLFPSTKHQWHPKFSNDGLKISFSGENNNRFNLFQLHIETKELTQLTAVKSGVFQHILNESESKAHGLVYTHRGYEVAEFELLKPQPAQPMASDEYLSKSSQPESKEPSVTKSEFSVSDYSPWSTLLPKWWFPFAVGNENTLEIGAQTSGLDALENHFYLAAVSLEVERLLPNLFLQYQYHHSIDFQLQFYHDIADDNDNSTSDLVIQNTDLEIGYHIPKSSVLDAWDLEFALSFETERYYIWFQEELNFVREFRDAYTGIALTYDSAKHFARSISANDGRSIRAVLATSDILESDFSGNTGLIDWREYIQIHREHALALRMIAGSGDNEAQPFRVGGDFSDLFLFRAPTLLERRYALRGYPDYSDELTGRHLRYLSTEWRFPIAYVERTWMSPPLGIEKLSGRIFYDQARVFGHTAPAVLSRSHQLADRIYRSSGAELMMQLRLFYYLPLDVRLGYANGHDKELGEDQVYVHFGTSF